MKTGGVQRPVNNSGLRPTLLLLPVCEPGAARQRAGVEASGCVVCQITLVAVVAAELAQDAPAFYLVYIKPLKNRSEQVKMQGAAQRATKTYRKGRLGVE